VTDDDFKPSQLFSLGNNGRHPFTLSQHAQWMFVACVAEAMTSLAASFASGEEADWEEGELRIRMLRKELSYLLDWQSRYGSPVEEDDPFLTAALAAWDRFFALKGEA